MIDYKDDIPRHKRKKKSSTSKSKEKSNHKHEYKDCLLVNKETNQPHKANYCIICGKIGEIKFFDTAPMIDEKYGTVYRMLNAKEIFEKYKGLEKIYIDDIWQKYVPINNKG